MPSDNTTVPAANPQEVADRAAIEQVWQEFWAIEEGITEIPVTERESAIDPLAINPVRAELLSSAARADADGVEFFGTSTLHPYWYRAVDGQPFAVLGDCRDTSNIGTMNRASGEKLSQGVIASNTVGSFVRDSQTGSWKLWQVNYITDLPCVAQSAS